MAKINLSSIQNKAIKDDKIIAKKEVTQKEVKTSVQNSVIQKDDFNLILQRIKEGKNKPVIKTVEQPILPVTKQLEPLLEHKQEVETKPLTESEKTKLIGLLHLYIAEFPDKLNKYKGKNFYKMSDKDLLDIKDMFKKEVTTSNNLTMAVEASIKMLELYEFTCCNFGVNIKGVSKIGESEEYKQTVKAVILKYFDNSLISNVEPEYKLAYLIISNSLICHQLNSMNETTAQINNIEKPLITNNKVENTKVNNISEDEDAKKLKELQLRNLNDKYNDL